MQVGINISLGKGHEGKPRGSGGQRLKWQEA